MRRRRALSLLLLLPLAGCLARDPVTDRLQISLISKESEIRMGRNLVPRFIKDGGGEVPSPAVREYVSSVGLRLARASHWPDLPFEFRVLNTETVNAFALPGGFIFVTRGILGKMENEAQLAAVLGHEIGHACARHGVERLQKALGIELLIMAGAVIYHEHEGEAPPPEALALARIGEFLTMMKFSRDDEREADRLGMEYMVSVGYDPREMISLFEMFDRLQRNETPAWLSTHPPPRDRIKLAERRVAGEYSGYELDGMIVGTMEYRKGTGALSGGRRFPVRNRQ